jgi:hypothetical protein
VTEHLTVFDDHPDPVHPRGPFDTEPRGPLHALRSPHGRAAHRRILSQALDGVELGTWDELILDWLCMWEHSTLVTIAGWIWRARMASSTDDASVTNPGPHSHA